MLRLLSLLTVSCVFTACPAPSNDTAPDTAPDTDTDPLDIDDDGDGMTENEGDCDDDDAETYPGADEVCDAVDNNCDGSTDEGLAVARWYADTDSDGFGDVAAPLDSCAQPAGYAAPDTDCDDTSATVNPGATETPYNGIDDDCDASTPDDDLDGDGHLLANDCNDNEPLAWTGAPEIPGDGIDNDCDPTTCPECSAMVPTPTVGSAFGLGTCYTEELECGSTYTHTLVGGDDSLGFDNYSDWFCQGMYSAASPQEYDGPERMYYFDSPAGATVTVTTECDHLAVRSAPVSSGSQCLTAADGPIWCETPNGIDARPYVLGPNELGFLDTKLAIIVDTLNGVGGAYTITVDCP